MLAVNPVCERVGRCRVSHCFATHPTPTPLFPLHTCTPQLLNSPTPAVQFLNSPTLQLFNSPLPTTPHSPFLSPPCSCLPLHVPMSKTYIIIFCSNEQLDILMFNIFYRITKLAFLIFRVPLSRVPIKIVFPCACRPKMPGKLEL